MTKETKTDRKDELSEQLKSSSPNKGYPRLDVNGMTRKQFDELPLRGWSEDIGEFDSLIILPLRRKHDSGYRCMDFVATKSNKPLCRLSGCSDVLHINGIGGYGKNWLEKYGTVPKMIELTAWNIDCLPKSGLLRIFGDKLTCGTALSSFEIFGEKRG